MGEFEKKIMVVWILCVGCDFFVVIIMGVVLCGVVIGIVGWWYWGFVLLMILVFMVGVIEFY